MYNFNQNREHMKTIGLFCGGYSSEFDISMKSAQLIYENLPSDYRVLKIIVSKEAWHCELNDSSYPFDLNRCEVEMKSERIPIDLGIICIHGDPGENGKIQAFLSLHGIPCANSDFQSSSLSFDKYICNQFLNAQGIPTAKAYLIEKGQAYDVEGLCSELGTPLFVKPTDSGSSYGISKVYSKEELPTAIDKAFKEGNSIVVESFLDGIELTCAVFRSGNEIRALPITQIISENDFFDYDAKYNGKSSEVTPANVDESVSSEIQELSKEIYDILRLKSVARIDYILAAGVPHVIEVNTIPGFSEASIVPQMLQCAGIEISEFWKMIIDQEINRLP